MKIIFIISAILFFSCNMKKPKPNEIVFYPTYTKELEDSTKTIKLTYIAWFCQCANWATESDIARYRDTGKLSEHSVFVEPADSTLQLPDTIGYSGDIINFTGRFYKEKGYPKKYLKTEMQVEKAKVFRYTKYEILESGYKNFKDISRSN
jgi:hypothetical protein